MFKIITHLIIATFAFSANAHAAPILVRVSGKGADAANCGGVANPCRTLQYAHDLVAAGGNVVVAIDPGDFGTVTLTKGVTLASENADAVLRSAMPGNAITAEVVNGAVVRLRGLTLDGAQKGSEGVAFTSMGGRSRLEIESCDIRNFAAHGISAAGVFSVRNSSMTNVGGVGVRALYGRSPDPVKGYLSGLRLNANARGGVLAIPTVISSITDPPASSEPIEVVALDTSATGHLANSGSGFRAEFGTQLVLRRVTSANNSVGLSATDGATLLVGQSVLTGNNVAASTIAAVRPPTLASFGDNVIRGNASDTLGLFTPGALH